jgi:hypothetical protein
MEDKSPVGKFNSQALKTRRIILPLRVFGSLSLNSISLGAACADSPSFTNLAISAFYSSEGT